MKKLICFILVTLAVSVKVFGAVPALFEDTLVIGDSLGAPRFGDVSSTPGTGIDYDGTWGVTYTATWTQYTETWE